MSKLEEAKEMLDHFQTSNRLGEEAKQALIEANANLNLDTLTEAIRKTQEWQLVRRELMERLDNWQIRD